MEETPTQPEFAGRERAMQWLGSRLLSHLILGLGAVLVAFSDTNFLWWMVGVLTLPLVLVQLRSQPPHTLRGWGAERATTFAASDKLGLNGSLMWMVNAFLTVVTGVGFLVALIIRWM